MSSTTALKKISICIVILAAALIHGTEGSCWRYGHSCWGGHGKRSGNSRVILRKMSAHIPSQTDGLTAQYPEQLPSLQQPAEEDSSTDEVLRRKPLSFPRISLQGNDLLRDEMQIVERAGSEEDTPVVEMPDYDLQNDPSYILPTQSKREGNEVGENSLGFDRPDSYYDASTRNSLENEDGLKRPTGDFSSRKAPKGKLLLYKLVKVLRKK